jgi:hypothetical protein
MSCLLAVLRALKSIPGSDIPDSIHRLEKFGDSVCPNIEPEELRLNSGLLYAFNLGQVISSILASNELTKEWSYGDGVNHEKFRSVMMSKSVQVYKDEMIVKGRNETHLFLICSIWLDEYRMSLSKNDLLTAVVLRVENLKSTPQFLLSLLPSPIKVEEYLEASIIPFFQKLESGKIKSYFAPSDSVQLFSGGINAILGDHVV